MTSEKKPNRKQQILQCLAEMLEQNQGKRITTAALAEKVGVSEAALYRHFPSKAKMFEGLIGFIEDTIFSRINEILENEKICINRLQLILHLVLGFADKNPGITRLLTGDALQEENTRLQDRIGQLFDRLETQLKQIIRERKPREGKAFALEDEVVAMLLINLIDGRLQQFVRSHFQRSPTENLEVTWHHLAATSLA